MSSQREGRKEGGGRGGRGGKEFVQKKKSEEESRWTEKRQSDDLKGMKK